MKLQWTEHGGLATAMGPGGETVKVQYSGSVQTGWDWTIERSWDRTGREQSPRYYPTESAAKRSVEGKFK